MVAAAKRRSGIAEKRKKYLIALLF